MGERERIVVCRLGTVDYRPAWDLQRQIQDRIIRAKKSNPAENIPHVMLLVEHPPVYTLGKSGKREHLLATEEELRGSGATFVPVDRGGDITYHGPGQLVLYPILDLDRFFRDIHRYMRELEETVIRTCSSFDVFATRVPGRTGVWITPGSDGGVARKICAMGIRCSRWVTMHGIGFNLNTELNRYSSIVPCGISDGDVTSLAEETGRSVDENEVQLVLLRHFADVFASDITIFERSDADAFLRTYLAPEALPVL